MEHSGRGNIDVWRCERDKVKIAQIAPLMESVPPRLYGGTERIVSYLTEELVGLGHEVTLFASGDLITTADLVPVRTQSAPARRQVSAIQSPTTC